MVVLGNYELQGRHGRERGGWRHDGHPVDAGAPSLDPLSAGVWPWRGLVSSFSLPVALFPQVDFPRVVVEPGCGRPPGRAHGHGGHLPGGGGVRSVPGVRECPLHHQPGQRRDLGQFRLGQDMVAASSRCESAINQILPRSAAGHHLQGAADGPDGVSGPRLQPDFDTQSLVELRDIALLPAAARCFPP